MTTSEGTFSDQPIAAVTSGAYAPLRRSVFRAIWLASLVSNIGTWMQNVGAAWLMTDLSPSPFMVALIQAASTLPVFFMGIPAGILADIIDRRRLLLVAQTWMLLTAGLLAVATMANWTTPIVLLALTFALGCGFALNAPAWQAIIPELVPRDELPAAIGLNGVAMNASRAVGPALGGLVVATAGPGAAFTVNAVSFVAVVFVLFRWKRPASENPFPAERFFGAARAGLRFVRHAPAVRTVLLRTMAFVSGASGLWALLPAITKSGIDRGPGAYGILLGCLGIGAVFGMIVLPKVVRLWGSEVVVLAGTFFFAGGTAVTATFASYPVWCIALVIAGAGWLAVLTSLSAAVQSIAPDWVRARVISVYLLIFYGGLAGGSIVWGVVAEQVGSTMALGLSAVWMVIGLLAAVYHRLPKQLPSGIESIRHWPEAPQVPDAASIDGPVLVLVEYRIRSVDAESFLAAASRLRDIRLRDGAFRWDLFEDAAIAGRIVESFMLESWAEHLRQHHRGASGDGDIEAAVRAFHAGDEPPHVSHFIPATSRTIGQH